MISWIRSTRDVLVAGEEADAGAVVRGDRVAGAVVGRGFQRGPRLARIEPSIAKRIEPKRCGEVDAAFEVAAVLALTGDRP